MFLDNTLAFSTFASPQAITTTAASTNVVDLTGAGSGNAPAMIGSFPAVNTAMGYDIGSADGLALPWLVWLVTTTGTTANTLTIALQAAPDNGSFSPGSYTSVYTSPAFTGTSLLAGSVLLVPVPPVPPDVAFGLAPPRFYRLNYTCSGALTVSAAAYLAISPETTLQIQKYASNFLAA
jgi:hypothetical protein